MSNLECEIGHKAEERSNGTHLHPMQLRVVVGFGEAREHKIIWILEEGTRAKASRSEH